MSRCCEGGKLCVICQAEKDDAALRAQHANGLLLPARKGPKGETMTEMMKRLGEKRG